MGKGNGGTRTGNSGSPRGFTGNNAPAIETMSVDDIVRMRGSNQPNINTRAVERLEDSYERQYRISENIRPQQRYATYEQALDRGDHNDVLKVLEDRGDRVLVASLVYGVDLPIHPTEVVLKKDIRFHRTKKMAQDFNSRR